MSINIRYLEKIKVLLKSRKSGGWSGIRTHEGVSPSPVFKTGAFNRSAIHPQLDIRIFQLKGKNFFYKIFKKIA